MQDLLGPAGAQAWDALIVNSEVERTIRDIDFRTVPESGYSSVPVLVAIPGAVSKPLERGVTDIIGTRGVKVRLGTQEHEITYIGVAGIPASFLVDKQGRLRALEVRGNLEAEVKKLLAE